MVVPYLKWIFVVIVLVILMIVTLFYNDVVQTTQTFQDSLQIVPLNIINDLVKERNALSEQLNEARQTIGRLQCEHSKDMTNAQGGWCKSASTENGGEHMTDTSLLPVLEKFLMDKTVSSFGDGPGIYKRELLKNGLLKSYDAFDGAPFCEETSEGRVKFMDLTIPQYGIPLYDWIISLEVAEHIPTKYENIYLDNIFRHAKEGIILSWAVPGQGGLSHTNNRPLEYVINIMEKNGFSRDLQSSKLLQDAASLPWIKSNLNVYRRDNRQYRSDDEFLSLFL